MDGRVAGAFRRRHDANSIPLPQRMGNRHYGLSRRELPQKHGKRYFHRTCLHDLPIGMLFIAANKKWVVRLLRDVDRTKRLQSARFENGLLLI